MEFAPNMKIQHLIALALTILTQPFILSSAKQPGIAQASDIKQRSRPTQAACKIEQNNEFFEQFVYGNNGSGIDRSTYTWPHVQVRSFQDPTKPLAVISKKEYNAFKIRLIDFYWSFSEPSTVDDSSYTRLKLDRRKIDSKTFRVDYVRAKYQYKGGDSEEESLVRTYGEPGAYIFEHRNGCWNLTKELRSTKSATAQAIIAEPQAVTKLLAEKMPYADLRRTVLSKGWLPLVDPDCKKNVGGVATICEEKPELEACSGDGYCRMNFEHMSGGQKLAVGTYGRPPVVRWWEFK
jgi:hypothetical protein